MADDKFIMINIDDERSRDIADVISNKTCKKIIDYLSETQEASEKDISDGLSIPINTVEYNLNKLIRAGLIEKAKNFFWSKKGRKIDMYKLAKKHIVISPKSKPNMDKLRSIIPIILVSLFLIVALLALFVFPEKENKLLNNTQSIVSPLKQFQSMDELRNFLITNANGTGEESYGMNADRAIQSAPTLAGAGGANKASSESASDFSRTNVQVEGVDEADIVKNDGKYIYTVNGNKVVIVNSYPATTMRIASEINVSWEVSEIFVNKDKLIVFSSSYQTVPYKVAAGVRCLGKCGEDYGVSSSVVYIYDISDRENPKLERNISIEGNYVDSRMIGDYVYLVANKYIDYQNPEPPIYILNGVKNSVSATNIYYPDYISSNYVFSTVAAINTQKDEFNSKVYLTGGTENIFVSKDNIYLTYLKNYDYTDYYKDIINEVYLPLVSNEIKNKIIVIRDSNENVYQKMNDISKLISDYSGSLSGEAKTEFDGKLLNATENFNLDLSKKYEKTTIHKINLDGININYKIAGKVPGHILNQFSMDEYNRYFRIATTVGDVWGGNSLNNIYVLDENMDIIGSVEDLAKGEKIYSARFMGDRGYIVTFKKVDPFFVIDLSLPTKPKVLGYLKIPGFSDYLHPYDENHVIGIGKDAIDASVAEKTGRNLDFAWYQGLKISIFDVTDVEHPIEQAKFVIGDRGTDSPILSDHRALLFSKEKNLMVIPVSVAEIDKSKYRICSESEQNNYRTNQYCLTPNTYGQQVWQGAYVLNIDASSIKLQGKITHNGPYSGEKYGPARDEPIGAKRTDENGVTWTKTSFNNYYGEWRGPEQYSSIRVDSDIDMMPGGINYHPNFYDYRYQIQRSLFMNNTLYTVSQGKIKANDLSNLNEVNHVDISQETVNYPVNVY